MAGELADALIARIDQLIADRLDAAITSRLAAAAYVAPNNAAIAAIQGKTDLISADGPASATVYTAARAANLDNLNADVSGDAARVWAAATRTLTAAPSAVLSVQQGGLSLPNYSDSGSITIAPVGPKAVLVWLGCSLNIDSLLYLPKLSLSIPATVTANMATNSQTYAISLSFCVVDFA